MGKAEKIFSAFIFLPFGRRRFWCIGDFLFKPDYEEIEGAGKLLC